MKNIINNIIVVIILIATIQCQNADDFTQDLNDFNPFNIGSANDPNQIQFNNFTQTAFKSLNNNGGTQLTTKAASTTKPLPSRRGGPNGFFRSSKNAKNVSDIFNIGLNFTKTKIRTKNVTYTGRIDKPMKFLNGVTLPAKFCPFNQNISCNSSDKYQSFDGSCNNLKFPWYGKTETPYKRLLEPEYGDGFDSPRTLSVSNKSLPNPRLISRTIMNDNSQFEKIWTNIFTHFGQFLTHDITGLSLTADANGNPLSCPCGSTDSSCFSVPMPQNENIMKMSCMQFTRSSPTFPTANCNLGYREQLNLLSSFIDGSAIYGSSLDQSKQLRLFSGGFLKSIGGVSASRNYLPKSDTEICSDKDPLMKCFIAGDGRASENLGLASVHTLFMREHNRIATELAKVNKKWNDERLFYESRRILVAFLQHITYSQFAPSILGWGHQKFRPLNNSYFTGYNSNANPGLSNEFAAAAFRYGHSVVRNNFNRFFSNNSIMVASSLNISQIIFKVDEAYNAGKSGIESIFAGLINDQSSFSDLSIADTLQNHLFERVEADGSIVAIDLAATNINRGRDHGLPPYVKYRELCGLKTVKTFQDLQGEMDQDSINKLASIYEDVADIDLWVGGLAEFRKKDAIVGRTLSCIIANQFQALKTGDRFYYENAPSATDGTEKTAFTLDQLNEIKKISLSSMICKDFDITSIQPNVFFTADADIKLAPKNAKVPCSSFPTIDFSKWKE